MFSTFDHPATEHHQTTLKFAEQMFSVVQSNCSVRLTRALFADNQLQGEVLDHSKKLWPYFSIHFDFITNFAAMPDLKNYPSSFEK